MAGFKNVKASFAKYTENETIGLSITDTGTVSATAIPLRTVVTLTGVDYKNKTATGIAVYADSTASATPAPKAGVQFILAEDYPASAKYFVVYRLKDDDAIQIDSYES